MRRTVIDTLLAIGFLGVTVAILVAWMNPASHYEPSMYAGVPGSFWIGIGVALAIATGVAMVCRGREQVVGIGLGGFAVTTIVSIPVLRNYRFSGMGDALTHLGWTRDIVNGDILPHDLFYPAFHSLAGAFHFLGGYSLERAMLIVVVVLFVPFLVFVPLVVREFGDGALAVGFAAIVSWMVLPINNVATHMGVHTNSNALFLVPPVLFAVAAYLERDSGEDRLPLGVSPFSILLFVTGVSLLLVHPQQMIGVVALIGTISAVQFLVRRRYVEHPILEHPTTYVHTFGLGILTFGWAISNPRFRNALSGLIEGIFSSDVGGGNTVNDRGTSLTELGTSLTELFTLMFLEAALIGLAVGLLLLAVWRGWSTPNGDTRAFITYLGLSMFPLGGLFLVYFVGTPTMAFRQMGFIYVVVTVLAGVALARGVGGLSKVLPRPGVTALAAAFVAVCLVFGLITVHASPLIYSSSQHVTNEQMGGYETALDHGVEDQQYAGFGYSPYRFDHAITGVDDTSVTSGTTDGTVDEEEFNDGNYSGAYRGSEYYFVVTEYDTTREFQVYDELRYEEEGLEGISAEPGADKVVSNDEFRMYDVEGSFSD
ncbi:hypothetical protein ACFQGT_11600 [Natrialbaceae archaeon GCM10025810]|uniref:hypothetical protein n=1 Tax=Halovalidus salilacus TaxID=3075124 RepID=UPI00360DD341